MNRKRKMLTITVNIQNAWATCKKWTKSQIIPTNNLENQYYKKIQRFYNDDHLYYCKEYDNACRIDFEN